MTRRNTMLFLGCPFHLLGRRQKNLMFSCRATVEQVNVLSVPEAWAALQEGGVAGRSFGDLEEAK